MNTREARRTERFDRLDVNNNGRIESREWDGTVAAFNRLDVNNDNVLTRAELANAGFDGLGRGDVRADDPRGRHRAVDRHRHRRPGGRHARLRRAGTVQLSENGNDIAGVGGARSGRRAADAPLVTQTAGALIARSPTRMHSL